VSAIFLGINIDHIATLRQARGTNYPDPIHAAAVAEHAGADGITIHLREDRRHIQDRDVYLLAKTLKTRMNFEFAVTEEMIAIACEVKPAYACLVPEKREELTTEGGLDVAGQLDKITSAVTRLADKGIKVSLFIDPKIKNVEQALKLNADNIELHTGTYCNLLNNKNKKKINLEFEKIKKTAVFAKKNNLGVHCGHGLNYLSAKKLKKIKEILEFNIGHFIISDSIFFGLTKVIKNFTKIIKIK